MRDDDDINNNTIDDVYHQVCDDAVDDNDGDNNNDDDDVDQVCCETVYEKKCEKKTKVVRIQVTDIDCEVKFLRYFYFTARQG